MQHNKYSKYFRSVPCENASQGDDRERTCTKTDVEFFNVDYIVLGVGTAGSVICHQLSKDTNNTVLGIERGIDVDEDPLIKTQIEPLIVSQGALKYFINYQSHNEPSLVQNPILVAAGEPSFNTIRIYEPNVLGGQSSVDSQLYVQGSSAYFNRWASTVNSQEWNSTAALDSFRRLERYFGLSDTVRGNNGLFQVRQTPNDIQARFPQGSQIGTYNKDLVSALQNQTNPTQAIQKILDYNNPATPIGVFNSWQLSQKSEPRLEQLTFHQRSSASNSFLMCRPSNLRILTESTAEHLIFERAENGEETNVVIGVRFLNSGKPAVAFARKRVVLSLGPIQTPIFLNLNGIGPQSVLRDPHVHIRERFINENVGAHVKLQPAFQVTMQAPNTIANSRFPILPQGDLQSFYTGGAFLSAPTAALAGPLGFIALIAGGSGFTSQPTITVSGGGGGAMATAVFALAGLSVSSPGTGYITAPVVTISGGGGSGAAAVANINGTGAISSLTLTNAGTGYTDQPTVTIAAPPVGGIMATALATMTLTSIVLTAPGNFTMLPTVTITGGGGSGAVATASFGTTAFNTNNTRQLQFIGHPSWSLSRTLAQRQQLQSEQLGSNVTVEIRLLDVKSEGTVRIWQSGVSHSMLLPKLITGIFSDGTPDSTILAQGMLYMWDSYVTFLQPLGYIWASPPAAVMATRNIPNIIAMLLDGIAIYARDNTSYLSSSCQMGQNAASGVVDQNGSVFGIQRLSIGDLSIAPFMPDGDTTATALFIGDNVARLIRQLDQNVMKTASGFDLLKSAKFHNRWANSSMCQQLGLSDFERGNLNGMFIEDFVIAGIGTATAGLAVLLSDSLTHSVLGIEKGIVIRDERFFIDALTANGINNAQTTNIFNQRDLCLRIISNVPEPQLRNRQNVANYDSSIVGGQSMVNAKFYVRGSPGYWDQTASFGSRPENWSAQQMERSFIEMEHFLPNGVDSAPLNNRRGYNGPIYVHQATPTSEIASPSNPLPQATPQIVHGVSNYFRIPEVQDYNDFATPIGVDDQTQTWQGPGIGDSPPGPARSSTGLSMLYPLIDDEGNALDSRRKLRISTQSYVVRILWSQEEKPTALGVLYYKDNYFYVALAQKEVIIGGGAFKSPQLLELSGYGDAKILKKFNIKVIKDNPLVGENMWDHLQSGNLIMDPPLAFRYPGAAGSKAIISSDVGLYGEFMGFPEPDSLPLSLNPPPSLLRGPRAFCSLSFGPFPGANFRHLQSIMLTTPKSRGWTHIQSRNPITDPLIYHNIFDPTTDDARRYALMLMLYYQMYLTQLQPLGWVWISPVNVSILSPINATNIELVINTIVLPSATDTQHPGGTCRIGKSIADGVVNDRLQVFDVRNLRVCDNSILPTSVDANTAAPATVIGFNLARMLKEQYGN